MTGKEFLQNKYPKQLGGALWNTNENIDDNWVAQMLDEYHESKVKELNLACVSNLVCEKCQTRPEVWIEENKKYLKCKCGKFKQTCC